MIGAVIGIILLVIIVGVLFWAGQRLIALVPLDEPFRTIIYVLVAVLAVFVVIWVFIQLLALAGIHVPLFDGRIS